MKTAIVELQTYDDLPTLQDKLLWARAPRILLVWPASGAPRLHGPLDFVRLRRYAARLGARLAVVTRDPQVAAWARQARVAVFPSVEAAQRASWRVPRRRPRRPRRRRGLARPQEARPAPQTGRWTRAAAALAGVWAVVALLAFVLPGARVEIPMPTRTQEATLTLWARPGGGADALPLQAVSVTVAGDYERPVVGTHPWPARPATGVVVLRNLGSDPVRVPSGLRITTASSPQVVFETTRGGLVPGGVGQSIRLPVVALRPGRAGNRPADDLRLLHAPWDLRLTATNPEPTQGGADRAVLWPQPREYTALREMAEADLRAQAVAALDARGGLWVPASLTLDATPQAAFTPPQPEPAAVLRLHLEQRYRAWALEPQTVDAWLTQALDADLDPGWQAVAGSLRWTPLEPEPHRRDDGWVWRVRATRQVYAAPRADQVAAWVRGRTPGQAAAHLQQRLHLPTRPQIRVWPAFWPWLPWWEARVQVEIIPQGVGESAPAGR